MIILQIEHPVPDYNNWKKAFDSDPVNRKQSGVKHYKIQTDDRNYVIIELELSRLSEAEGLFTELQKLWNNVEGTVMMSPKTRIIECVESKEC